MRTDCWVNLGFRVVEGIRYFEKGEMISRGDLAVWMEDDSVPIGLVVHPHKMSSKLYTVSSDRDGALVLTRDDEVLYPDDVRKYRRLEYHRENYYNILSLVDKGYLVSTSHAAGLLDIQHTTVAYHLRMANIDGMINRNGHYWGDATLTEAGKRAINGFVYNC